MSDTNQYSIDILDIAIEVIEYLAKDTAEFQKPSVIASQLGINRTRVFRILKTLGRRGYVEYNSQNLGYRLGLKFLTLSESIRININLRKEAELILKGLSRVTGEASFLYVLVEHRAICIEFCKGENVLQIAATIGESLPLYIGAAPKILLAFLPDEERERIIQEIEFTPYTPNSIIDRNELRKELNTIRDRGYSINHEEYELGVNAIGAPIRDYSGKVIAGLSLDIPTIRFTPEQKDFLREQLCNAALELSSKLGFQVPTLV
jgi:IclR family transcriptional regulator, KDG regulon repressor